MKSRKIFLLAIGLTFLSRLVAQPTEVQKFLPQLSPASPEVTGLGQFGKYEVNLFTGLPDISIPIFDIKVGELNVPITLSYHPSGIRVNDIASWTGLGWSLQTGGAITRKVMGKPDENAGNYLSATSTSANRVRSNSEIDLTTQDGVDYLQYVWRGIYDVQPDIFSYNFPGHNGSFIFNQKNNFKPFFIPYAPIEVVRTKTTPTLGMEINDESGINYKFEAAEETASGSGTQTYATSAWLMTKMTSANKQDAISFSYNQTPGYETIDSYFSDYVVVTDNTTGICNADIGNSYSDLSTISTQQQILSQITFKNGKVVFEAGMDARADHNGVFTLQNRLRYIKIYSYDGLVNQYNLIRTIELYHSYFSQNGDAATYRLRLDSIQFKGGNNAYQTYKFEYNNAISLPSHYSTSKDWWGYYNNVLNLRTDGVPTTVPHTQIQYNQGTTHTQIWIGGGRTDAREPNPDFNQACMLQKITYPTGGYTKFDFETNQYLDDQQVSHYAGGLRIHKITSYSDANTTTPVIKTYKYGSNESGFGRANFITDNFFFARGQSISILKVGEVPGVNYVAGTENISTYVASPTVLDIVPYDGAPVVYPLVTEYLGDEINNSGKTIYQFNDKPDAKTDVIGLNAPIIDSYHFLRGLLINKSDFKQNVDKSYTIVAETRNTYQAYPFEHTTGGVGLAVLRKNVYKDSTGEIFGGPQVAYPLQLTINETNNYLYNNYEAITSDNKLVSNTKIEYDQNDPSRFNSVLTTFTYDDVTHLQTSQVQTTNSKNETITSSYVYPYNFNVAPYTDMTGNHIFNRVIEETKSNSVTGQLTQQSTNYASFAGNNYLPSSIQLQVKTNPVDTRALFNQYDVRGNILEMQKTNDVKQSIIWDYESLHPVAMVTNSGVKDVAYTSFEADGTGNWTFTGYPILDPTTPTGKKCYSLTTGTSITNTGLSDTSTYIVSYWKKSGTVDVNGTSSITGYTISGWTYYEHKITNPTNGKVTVSGTGIIDELRLYPQGAEMTTYTYSPLIGVTSKCDINNQIVYNEYDQFNRLMLIRDQNKNILKQFCYNYAGQPENCNIVYNDEQSGVFYKSVCVNCQTGVPVTYTVPANTYSAPTKVEANQMAVDDVSLNGQSYANAVGACAAPVSSIVDGSNASSQDYTVTFHNNCTIIDYNFPISANHAVGSLGNIPAGIYNVIFNPHASSPHDKYMVNSLTLSSINGTTIYGVTIGAGGAVVNITPTNF